MPSGITCERCDVAIRPLCIDLFHGLGGWGESALAAGFRVIGIDLVDMYSVTGRQRLDGIELVRQDILTLHGSQFKDASLLLCSPPCQKYSWLSMPWSRSGRIPCKACEGKGFWIGIPCLTCKQNGWIENSKAAKALRRDWEENGPDNRLFDACFRIQQEASEAAGRYIPMVLENVRGAQEWVGVRNVGLTRWLQLSRRERIELGRSKARFGSFHLYGNVGMIGNRIIVDRIQFGQETLRNPNRGGVKLGGGLSWSDYGKPDYKPFGFNVENERDESGLNRRDQYAEAIANGIKVPGDMRDEKFRFTQPRGIKEADGTKIGGDWFRDPECHSAHGSRSSARKIASAEVAKIPPALAYYIAKSFMPTP